MKQEPYIGMPVNLMELEGVPCGCRSEHPGSCPEDTSMQQPLQPMVLAMAYVPWQRFENTYDLNKALDAGTIFPELDLPFGDRKGGMQ